MDEISKQFVITESSSIKDAMKAIDRSGLGLAFIVDSNNKFCGLVTDGDIRRAILQGTNIDKPVEKIVNRSPLIIRLPYEEVDILNLINSDGFKSNMPFHGSLKIPVICKDGAVKDIIFVYTDEKKAIRISKYKSRAIEAQPANGGIKKVLLIGGAGYLGSVLSRKLLLKGYKVRVLDNLSYGDDGIRELNRNPDFELIKGDIREIPAIIGAIKGVDAVGHLAAIVGDSASALNPEQTIEINYLATKAIAEACKFAQINRFFFASTCSVYGANKNPDERLDEDSPLNPVSLYAETKLRSEQGILSIADANFSPTIFRFATLFGVSPRMRFDLVINLLTAKAVKENKITIFGGEQWRPHLDVSDAAEAFIRWLESPIEKVGGEIFNVGSNELNFKINAIGDMVREVVPGIEVETQKESSDSRDYNVSFEKISKRLNFEPQKSIKQAICEIKELLESKIIRNFNHKKYNNYRFLSELKGIDIYK